jgi:hypothetical protein
MGLRMPRPIRTPHRLVQAIPRRMLTQEVKPETSQLITVRGDGPEIAGLQVLRTRQGPATFSAKGSVFSPNSVQ